MTEHNTDQKKYNAALVLADGGVFFGHGVGAEGIAVGELCFTTGMTGYQETLTDPSYAGQIVTFTFPHIGNVGANEEDNEATAARAKGVVMRTPITDPSNWRADGHLTDWLSNNNLVGISGVDTRAITRHIREHGAQNAAVVHGAELDIDAAKEAANNHPSMKGQELAKSVMCAAPYDWTETEWKIEDGFGTQEEPRFHVVAMDFGAKLNILRCLAERGCRVTVVPGTATAEEIEAFKPDGLFLSNGPGDPSKTAEYAAPTIKHFVESGIPIFGICLGHQILSTALGAKTEKLSQGHRGANHPVKQLADSTVEITSQNHGFAVMRDSLPKGVIETHVSLFDGTNEGIAVEGKPIFSVQHHPEASPGPRDADYLFNQFVKNMEEHA